MPFNIPAAPLPYFEDLTRDALAQLAARRQDEFSLKLRQLESLEQARQDEADYRNRALALQQSQFDAQYGQNRRPHWTSYSTPQGIVAFDQNDPTAQPPRMIMPFPAKPAEPRPLHFAPMGDQYVGLDPVTGAKAVAYPMGARPVAEADPLKVAENDMTLAMKMYEQISQLTPRDPSGKEPMKTPELQAAADRVREAQTALLGAQRRREFNRNVGWNGLPMPAESLAAPSLSLNVPNSALAKLAGSLNGSSALPAIAPQSVSGRWSGGIPTQTQGAVTPMPAPMPTPIGVAPVRNSALPSDAELTDFQAELYKRARRAGHSSAAAYAMVRNLQPAE